MLDFSFAEIALIVVVVVVFIGPKELPTVVKAVVKGIRAVKGLTREVREAFNELSEETGLKDMADDVNREVRMIRGDDGQYYESYDMTKLADKAADDKSS